jgi:hypothetical protein
MPPKQSAVDVTKRPLLASYDSYLEAQKAVDTLSDKGFPVRNVAIVGVDLRIVESVLGRLSWGRAAFGGLATGAWFGMLVMLLISLFTSGDNNTVVLVLLRRGVVVVAIAIDVGSAGGGGGVHDHGGPPGLPPGHWRGRPPAAVQPAVAITTGDGVGREGRTCVSTSICSPTRPVLVSLGPEKGLGKAPGGNTKAEKEAVARENGKGGIGCLPAKKHVRVVLSTWQGQS